jgi:hypothetical protein
MINKSTFVFCIALALFSSCGSDTGKNEMGTGDTASNSPANSKELAKAQQILYALPSPTEAAALIKSSGATFELSTLNPITNVSKYVSNESKAINLGVYGTDLVYANVFEQTQESAEYFKCANTLATSLGISSVFGEATYNRVKKNMQNQDSLMAIIADASLDADAYFKENERPTASALVAVGGWIEGLYIATTIAGKTKNASALNDLKEIKPLFDVLETKKTVAAKSAGTNEIPTIGVGKHIGITPEQLKAIAEKVGAVRNKIIM